MKVYMVDLVMGRETVEGCRILEAADALKLLVCNTMFKKEENKLVTYRSGDSISTLDYVC